MRISMPRGDIRKVPFMVTNPDGKPAGIDFDEIYFTVKRKASDTSFLFQKRLSTGGITKNDTNNYEIKISPEDTNNLLVNRPGEFYEFDIQLDYRNEIKETTCGELVITKEITYASNEG